MRSVGVAAVVDHRGDRGGETRLEGFGSAVLELGGEGGDEVIPVLRSENVRMRDI